jgi:hypothetical protein
MSRTIMHNIKKTNRGGKITHGMTGEVEYVIWKSMKRRCYAPRSISFKNYGGRGIKFSKSWMKFENFYKDMGKRPSPKHTIDRINNDGNYCKSNCRWVTSDIQASNRRNTLKLNIDGELITVKRAAIKYGLSYDWLRQRVVYGGMSHKDAALTPVRKYKLRKKIDK